MLLFCSVIFVFLVASVVEVTYGQSAHLITVGDEGSFNDPQVVVARKGDIVTFRWTGMFHSITQSSFAAPCTPLEGGFDSGVTGNPPGSNPTPEWNLTITDDTKPIWFFCKVTRPVSHCTAGMVGAINAVLTGTNESFDVFVQTAKSVKDLPKISFGLPPALNGVGALATSAPTPINNVTNATSAGPTSSSGIALSTAPLFTSPAMQTATAPTRMSADKKGGIAGGIIGAVLLLILLVLLLLFYRRSRRYRAEAIASKFILRSQSSPHMSHFDGHIRHSPLPPTPSMGQLHRGQASVSIVESSERDSTAGPSINIQELAAEIVKNMRQEAITEEPDRPLNQATILGEAPEQRITHAVSRVELPRVTVEPPRVRQLPNLPPPAVSRRAGDTHSVETLPVYISGHSR